jgi:hypothetical protein
MIAITMMLLLLFGCYLALGGLVYFCEGLIVPAPSLLVKHDEADGKRHQGVIMRQ